MSGVPATDEKSGRQPEAVAGSLLRAPPSRMRHRFTYAGLGRSRGDLRQRSNRDFDRHRLLRPRFAEPLDDKEENRSQEDAE